MMSVGGFVPVGSEQPYLTAPSENTPKLISGHGQSVYDARLLGNRLLLYSTNGVHLRRLKRERLQIQRTAHTVFCHHVGLSAREKRSDGVCTDAESGCGKE